MLDRHKGGETAVLVHVNFTSTKDQADLAELHELVISAGVRPADTVTTSRQAPEAKYFVGTGKAETIRQSVLAHQADVVIVNHALSPAQERNLEKLCQCRVIDRAGLILDIFAQRARTFEGKLQVELAQLEHMSTRLVRGWTHLERQRGGIGLRGPGETQLETDRRLLKARIDTIKKRLEKVRRQRAQNRRARTRQAIPVISLVGYTNAGKSTLFNDLTGAEVYSANQLFATLDPTLRAVDLGDHKLKVILVDTVGFIRNLPHELIAAFRATLEETVEASLLLHVVDASDPEKHKQVEQVHAVLKQIDADNIPMIEVYNKIDLLADIVPHLQRDADNKPQRVWLCAAQGHGTDLLKQVITEYLNEKRQARFITIEPTQSRLRSSLYELGAVLAETPTEEGNLLLEVMLSERELAELFPV